MELYLDTADTNIVRQLHPSLPLAGVTTNPSLVAKAGKPLLHLLQEMRDILGENAKLFAQVLSNDANEIIEQAHLLYEKCPNLIIKIPVTLNGLQAIKQLSQQHIPTLGTAVYGAGQGFLAALAGAQYVAPYVNRIDSQGGNGVATVNELQTLINQHSTTTKVLAASFKTPRQVLDTLLTGCQAITLPPEITLLFVSDPAVFAALDKFAEDWHSTFPQKFL